MTTLLEQNRKLAGFVWLKKPDCLMGKKSTAANLFVPSDVLEARYRKMIVSTFGEEAYIDRFIVVQIIECLQLNFIPIS